MGIPDKYPLIPEFLKARGLAKEHIRTFDSFINEGITEVLQKPENQLIVSDVDPRIYLRFSDIRVGRTTKTIDLCTELLTPQNCRLSDRSYSAPIMIDIEYSFYEEGSITTPRKDRRIKTAMKRGVIIGYMPIMLRSSRCVLRDKSEQQIAKLGECPLDPGGYFIIKGIEKVVMIQEWKPDNNCIVIENDNKRRVLASTTSRAGNHESTVVLVGEKVANHKDEENKLNKKNKPDNDNKYKLGRWSTFFQFDQFTQPLPIVTILRLLGVETNQEVKKLIGMDDPRCEGFLEQSFSDHWFSEKQEMSTKENLWKLVEFLVKPSVGNEEVSLKTILFGSILPNIPSTGDNLRPKCLYLGRMWRYMLEEIIYPGATENKHYVGNKRFMLSGQLISLLFEDLFEKMCSRTKKATELALTNRFRLGDISKEIDTNWITHGLEWAISTGNWNVKKFNMKMKGVTQVVSRVSFIGALGQLTRIHSQFEKSKKDTGSRLLHPSQWGMLCPCDTNEGESCGLVKNTSLIADFTAEFVPCELIALKSLHNGMEILSTFSAEDLLSEDIFLVILNGTAIGKVRRPQDFANTMRELRRSGEIGMFISIHVHELMRSVYISSDEGRLCRPLVIADKGTSRIKEHHMKSLKDGVSTFNDFLQEGLVEYLDIDEENNAQIALYEEDACPDTTHIEIEPFSLLGVCAGLIPFPHHNHSAQITKQCTLGKQAIGNTAYNQLCRMDTLQHLLVYPQRPLLTTKTIKLVGYDKLGGGQNATVAVMSFSGYDIGGAIVMNKSSLDRGFGRCIVMKKLSTVKKKDDRIIKPQVSTGEGGLDILKQILDGDGIASPGEIVRPHYILVDKNSRTALQEREYEYTPLKYKGPEGETAVVDKVALFTDDSGNLTIKCIICDTRTPEVGDKFSSRHGQKGVCGIIVQQEDLPFSESGICPDLIINPHEFASRSIFGEMLELLFGKAAALKGEFHDGSAFGRGDDQAESVRKIGDLLIESHFNYSGKDFMYSGITGCPLEAYIFMGPIYFQRLKQMALDKTRARARGLCSILTRRPIGGEDGGLRLGEMERDCLTAYGASRLTYERLMISGDQFEAQVCRRCGLLGYFNHRLKRGVCSTCKSVDNVSPLKLPYACKLLFQELHAMNIVVRLQIEEL